jgi:hypothetical protein
MWDWDVTGVSDEHSASIFTVEVSELCEYSYKSVAAHHIHGEREREIEFVPFSGQ